MRRLLFCLIWLTAGTVRAVAWTSPAPDVVLYCAPALEAVLGRASGQFTAASGVAVHIFTAPPDGLAGLLRHRARADVAVADAAAIHALADSHLVRPETVVPLGKNPYVLVGKSDAAFPEGADPARLLAAHHAVLTDATTAAGFDGAAVLQAALPAAAVQSEGVADTATVADRVREDPSLVGVVQQSEATGGDIRKLADLAAPPAGVAGALVVQGQSGNAAAFLAFLTGARGQAILRAGGVETSP